MPLRFTTLKRGLQALTLSMLVFLCAAHWPSELFGQQPKNESPKLESTTLESTTLGSPKQDSPADKTVKPLPTATEPSSEPIPPSKPEYMGRTIAPAMGYAHAAWLTRSTREQEEDPKQTLENLGLKPGMVVCDLGCGNGYYTLEMASRVQPTGKVFAVDIQPEMLHLLELRAEDQEVTNVEVVLGGLVDPRMPDNSIDLLLLVDVYHEFSHPSLMLKKIRKCLKPEGRIALVEFRAEDRTVPIRPEHKMTKKQILKEYKANGLKLVEEYDKLPWQHLMFFQRDPDWKDKAEKTEKDKTDKDKSDKTKSENDK